MNKHKTKRLTVVLLLICMLVTILPMGVSAVNEKPIFNDMKGDEYYAEAIETLAKLNILQGYPDGTFGADRGITRAEMSAIVLRSQGLGEEANKSKGKTIYDDVASTHWATGYINKATELEIIEGDGDGKFRPEDNVKYEEAIKMIVIAVGFGDEAKTKGGWPDGYISVAQENNILKNVPGSKRDISTRGAVALMTYQGLSARVKTPVVSVEEGRYTSPQVVTLVTETKGAKIYYTLDGKEPTIEDQEYTEAININSTSTLKAIAIKDDLFTSDVLTIVYTIIRNSSGGSSSVTTPAISVPILSLVDDNGALEFSLGNTKSSQIYKMYVKVNGGEFREISTLNIANPILIDKDSDLGFYEYKVVTTDSLNKMAESNVVGYMVVPFGSGITGLDSDGDGLPDDIEDEIGTDKYVADTDGDGLPDGYEYYILGTDPLKIDTDNDGISDADEDFDDDGLNNLQEYLLGTNPFLEDTDGDGLSDSDEINIYGTDPMLFDTDGDGLSDGDEILLGLNPLVQKTDGKTLDSERIIEQLVSQENIGDTLLEDNDAVPTLTLSGKGNINNIIAISEYDGVDVGDSRSYVGKPIEINDVGFEEAEIKFSLNSPATRLMSADSINTKLICGISEDEGPVFYETDYDVVSNSVSAKIDGPGVYYVIDVEELFNELGFCLPAEMTGATTKTTPSINVAEYIYFTDEEIDLMNNSKSQNENHIAKLTVSVPSMSDDSATEPASSSNQKMILTDAVAGQADIVFIIDTTGSMQPYIDNVRNNVTEFVDALKEKGIAPQFALVEFRDIEVDGYDSTRIHKNGSKNWFSDIEAYKSVIRGLTAYGGGDEPESDIDALETARLLDMRANAGKFFILVTDATYKVTNRYGIPSMAYEIDLLKNQKITTSVVTHQHLYPTYEDLVTETNGIFADLYNYNFKDELMVIADMIGEAVIDDGVWVYLEGLVPIAVKLKELPYEGSTVDTDGDGLPDIEELASINPTGTVDLDEILTKVSKGVITGTKYGVVKTYKYRSNPAVRDTDNDGYDDAEDLEPKKPFKTPVILLHGRGDNSLDCFGILTNAFDNKKEPQNGHYDSDRTLNNKDYVDVGTHKIKETIRSEGEKTPVNLGHELEHMWRYSKNRNLFAFNYPNKDVTQANAKKLSEYIDNLAKEMQDSSAGNMFYATKSDKENKRYKVTLIGHSNGGLVSRYFIENMGGSVVVDKLITIDTPHWGSGWANISDNLTTCLPMDVDLNPHNAIFGGTYKEYSTLNPFVQKKIKYINDNQTDELNYQDHGDTKYYFLAGYDVAAKKNVPKSHRNRNMPFDLNLEGISNFGDYKTAFRDGFVNSGVCPELIGDCSFENVFNLKLDDGDNVVNNQSQLGLKFDDDKDNSPLIKRIKPTATWVNIDTYPSHSLINHFHGENQHRRETVRKIGTYLK